MKRPQPQVVSHRIPGGAFEFTDDAARLFTITADLHGVIVERAVVKSEFELDLFRLALARAYHTREVMREHRSVGACQP